MMHSRARPDQENDSKRLDPVTYAAAVRRNVPPGILDACLFASLLLVVVICVCLVWETRAWTRNAAEQSELNLVTTLASNIHRNLESLSVSITETSKSLQVPGVWDLPPDLRQGLLFPTSNQPKGISTILVIGKDGRLRAVAGDQAPPAINFSDRPYFEFHQTHSDAAVQMSNQTKGRLGGKPVIVLSKRVNDSNGQFAGVVVGSVHLSYFTSMFRSADIGADGLLALVNTNGRVVAQIPADAPTENTDFGLAKPSSHVGNGAYARIATIDGRERLVAYHEIDGFSLVVAYAQPTENIFAQWVDGSSIIAGALFVLSSFGILIIRELRRERQQRADAEDSARLSAQNLSVANDDLEHRIAYEVQSRKETQEKLAKSQRLEALGQLAGGIAHDINNVLQTVTGACFLAQTSAGGNHEIRRLTAIAISAADRGSAVTQRLLLFARRAAITAEKVDTVVVLDDLQELLSHTLCDSVMLRLELAQDLPELIADRMQLETVIINLATNARDAMPDGGTITLAAKTEFVGRDDTQAAGLLPGTYVCLSVADTGIGMDEHVLARATEPFFSTKGVGQGTGLGLSMAKGFAEQSNGKMEIESRVDEGTVVSLWFPAGEMSRRPKPEQAQVVLQRHKPDSEICVLVVDDNTEASELVSEWLATSGFKIERAESGEQALSAIRAGLEIDLLLTDFSMPGMDGLQLIGEARSIITGLPAILLTGNVRAMAGIAIEDTIQERCLVLQKPVRLTDLARHIDAMLCDAPVQPAISRPVAHADAGYFR